LGHNAALISYDKGELEFIFKEGAEANSSGSNSTGDPEPAGTGHFKTFNEFLQSPLSNGYNRFIRIPISNRAAAIRMMSTEANSGYNVFSDNCSQAVVRSINVGTGSFIFPGTIPNSTFSFLVNKYPNATKYYRYK
jgi:hypothetical protein